MARDLVFEIGTEEMPAAYMPEAIEGIARLARQKLKEAGLEYEELISTGTPRRLVLYLSGLAETQPDSVREVKGPRSEQAYDENGQPTRAAQGFARAQGVKVEDLQLKKWVKWYMYLRLKGRRGRPLRPFFPACSRIWFNHWGP